MPYPRAQPRRGKGHFALGVREAAAALGVPPRRVYELIDEGRLPAIKRGRELRVQRPDLEALGPV
ncbi:MAG: helix-turn-helix domain-containing protein [Actinobacteria bacterium]|nr:helix-turn-helix domain-containing protein [Actinomycetota bacterium]